MAAIKCNAQAPGKWQNFVIVSFVVLVAIDSFPSDSKAVNELQSAIDPIMDVTGLWQEQWNLFAPEVDRENSWVEARVHIKQSPDPVIWRSPHWLSLSCFERFKNSREMEFYDRIRFRANEAAWPSYAKYLIRDYKKIQPDNTVTKIELISVAETTPPMEQAGTKAEAKYLLYYTLKVNE